MPIYKPGIETKEKIYQISKALFYECGYKKTTCANIAKAVNANVGLIHYHFGGKGALAAAIYSGYMQLIKEQVHHLIETHFPPYNLLKATAVEIRVHTDILLNDKNMNRFYMDILEDNILYKEETIAYHYYDKLAESVGLPCDKLHLGLITYGNFGAQQGLSLAHNAGKFDCSSTEFSNLSIELMLLIMGFNPTNIKTIQEESLQIFEKITLSMHTNFNYDLDFL